MNMFTTAEVTSNYAELGKKKTEKSFLKLFVSAAAAGAFVALTGAATNTLVHNNPDIASVKLLTGLLFPFALITVILMGFELFTSNCLISISVLDRKTTPLKMLRNLGIVYFGNFTGSFLVAASCAAFGQFNYSAGLLGAYTIKLAAAKCDMPFINAIGLGIFCNMLVCAAIICSYSAKDTTGRVLGAFGPVAIFVFCGFEHSIANMYYITAGLFAKANPMYAELAAELGVDMSQLTASGFLLRNLVPVTLGNIIGGVLVGVIMWYNNKQVKNT